MNPKKKHTLMHKLFCLSSLLLENLDELQATTPTLIKYKADLIGFCEELNNSVADTATIQKSTYFSNISNKIDTILRKEFNENM
jgi:hypothetical protein